MTKAVNIKFFKRLMDREGLNQRDLAARLQKSTTTISKMMNGQAPIRQKVRKDIADKVAADVDFIFPEIGEEKLAS